MVKHSAIIFIRIVWFYVSEANNDTEWIATKKILYLKELDILMMNGRNSPAIQRKKKNNADL